MEKPNNTKDNQVEKFRLSLVDDTTHKVLWLRRFSRARMIVAAVAAVVALLVGIFCLIAFTPIRTFIPGYPDARTKRQAIQNAMRIDSLETQILQWELYTENLKRVVSGEEPVRLDSLIRRISRERETADSATLASRDSLLRARVQEEEQFQVPRIHRDLPIEGVHFFTPVKGVVSQGYDARQHPYLDITAPAGSVVTAVLDGTVVFAGWDEDTGYTLVLQHNGDIISVYKRNPKLLKAIGESVKAGTPVALVGNSGSLTTGDHLHLELWYRGTAVDPAKYISF